VLSADFKTWQLQHPDMLHNCSCPCLPALPAALLPAHALRCATVQVAPNPELRGFVVTGANALPQVRAGMRPHSCRLFLSAVSPRSSRACPSPCSPSHMIACIL
jgi:hypothetical protein